jgi:hypothetical protein
MNLIKIGHHLDIILIIAFHGLAAIVDGLKRPRQFGFLLLH